MLRRLLPMHRRTAGAEDVESSDDAEWDDNRREVKRPRFSSSVVPSLGGAGALHSSPRLPLSLPPGPPQSLKRRAVEWFQSVPGDVPTNGFEARADEESDGGNEEEDPPLKRLRSLGVHDDKPENYLRLREMRSLQCLYPEVPAHRALYDAIESDALEQRQTGEATTRRLEHVLASRAGPNFLRPERCLRMHALHYALQYPASTIEQRGRTVDALLDAGADPRLYVPTFSPSGDPEARHPNHPNYDVLLAAYRPAHPRQSDWRRVLPSLLRRAPWGTAWQDGVEGKLNATAVRLLIDRAVQLNRQFAVDLLTLSDDPFRPVPPVALLRTCLETIPEDSSVRVAAFLLDAFPALLDTITQSEARQTSLGKRPDRLSRDEDGAKNAPHTKQRFS